MKEGFGILVWPNGRKFEGSWKQGRQHGEGKFTLNNGKAKQGIWNEGVRLRWIDTEEHDREN